VQLLLHSAASNLSRETALTHSVYLASPLGFAESTRAYLERVVARLDELGLAVHDPWSAAESLAAASAIRVAETMADTAARMDALRRANRRIAAANEAGIREAALVVAILDGADVESGTASEIGFAAALGRPIFGLRTDWRRGLENDGALVNLQIEWWIEQSGGSIVRSLDELAQAVQLTLQDQQ
jgi:nucleoside 2-deoxyribosyltransferase